MSDFYRERDRLAGGTDSEWVQAANYAQWQQATDFQDGDADDSADVVDMRGDDSTRFTGVLSQSDLAS